MKGFLKNNKIFLGLIGFVIFSSCSVATFQTPKLLNPGEKVVGVGTAGYYSPKDNDSYVAEIDIYGRFGIEKNKELGIKYLFPTGVCCDAKIQILEKPILVALDFMVSLSYYPPDYQDEYTISETIGFHPLLLFGRECLYGGIKYTYLHEETYLDENIIKYPSLMFGASMGDKFRMLPEINLLFCDENKGVIVVFGVGFQYGFY